MLIMTMSSAINISTLLINLFNGKVNYISIIPVLFITVAMIISTFLWPSLMRNYTKKKQKSKVEHQQKYCVYIEKKKELI